MYITFIFLTFETITWGRGRLFSQDLFSCNIAFIEIIKNTTFLTHTYGEVRRQDKTIIIVRMLTV